MKVRDKVLVLVHGAGVTSEEEHVIEEIDDQFIKVEDISDIFYKNKDGNYKTIRSSSLFGFWFEIKGD